MPRPANGKAARRIVLVKSPGNLRTKTPRRVKDSIELGVTFAVTLPVDVTVRNLVWSLVGGVVRELAKTESDVIGRGFRLSLRRPMLFNLNNYDIYYPIQRPTCYSNCDKVPFLR